MTTENRVPQGVPTGGQFAVSAKTESGVALDTTPTTPLGAAFREANLPGTFKVTSPETLTYTDTDGHIYDVSHSGGSVQVRTEDVNACCYRMSMNPKNPMTADEALDALGQCQEDATDARAFTAAAQAFVDTPAEDQGHGWRDPEVDDYNASVSFDGVTLSGFTRDDIDHRGTSLKVAFGVEGETEFTVVKSRNDGTVRYLRGDDWSHPLTAWERDALDREVAERLNRSGPVSSLSSLLRDAEKRARA